MIPPTRSGQPHRRVEKLAFGETEQWRPVRLVLDDSTLTQQEGELLVSFSQEEELDIWHTAPDAVPRFEIGEAFEAFPAMGGTLSIHTFGNDGTVGLFGVYGTERLRQRALEIAGAGDATEEETFRSLVFASASDGSDSDAIVTRRPYLLQDERPRAPVAVTPEDAFALIGLAMRSQAPSRSVRT